MKERNPDDLSHFPLLNLFQAEVGNQVEIITHGLLELEKNPGVIQHLQTLMRAAHSIKGAARIANRLTVVNLAHALEDCFAAAQERRFHYDQDAIDTLLHGLDLLAHAAQLSEPEVIRWEQEHAAAAAGFVAAAMAIARQRMPAQDPPDGETPPEHLADPLSRRENEESPPSLALIRPRTGPPALEIPPGQSLSPAGEKDRALRMTGESLNRLLLLTGESLAESRWFRPFAGSLLNLKRMQTELLQTLDRLRDALVLPAGAHDWADQAIAQAMECRRFLADRLVDLDTFDRRSASLSQRLHREVLQCRMRPFADGLRRIPRMARDLARLLGKQIRLEIAGENILVDSEMLEKLETPLVHLLRNAADHGCEFPEERQGAGKAAECTIRLEAKRTAGMLLITVADDGRGVPLDVLRETIARKGMASRVLLEKMSETDLLEFLLLPGFTLKSAITEISGRGVGLDVVQNVVKGVRGSVGISTSAGRGTRFQLQLPLTLSVLRALLAEVGGEPYAFPLSQIGRVMRVARGQIEVLGGRQYFALEGQLVGLLAAHQLFGVAVPRVLEDPISVIVLGGRTNRHGLVVDRFLGERELVAQPLDPRLGMVQGISSGSIMEDGSPVLIVDVEDLARSVEKLAANGELDHLQGRERVSEGLV